MITHVYDNANAISYQVTTIAMVDECFTEEGTSYTLDLVSSDGEITLYNVPLSIEVSSEGVYKYYMADISTAIEEGKTTYDYNTENYSRLYECGSGGAFDGEHTLTSYGATYTEPKTAVSIYQHGKEPLTQEATTIPDLIEILEYAQTLDYTEVVISGAFTKGIKMNLNRGE